MSEKKESFGERIARLREQIWQLESHYGDLAKMEIECEKWKAQIVRLEMENERLRAELAEYRSHLIHENEENERLTQELAKVNESPYSPAFLAAIAGTCSTPASRVGKTQAEVFDEEKK